jgi:GNAT superfamily N-acetyltransferase
LELTYHINMRNENTWKIAPYQPDLSTSLIDLHRRIWPQAEIADAAYQRWQYQENPAGQALASLAQEPSTGQVIGQFGALPVRVVIDGEERLAAIALNVATDPAYQRQGMFAALGAASDRLMAQAGVSLAFAMPNANSFPGFLSRLGYSFAGDVPFLVRPVNIQKLARSRLPIPLAALAGLASRPFYPPLPKAPREVTGVSVTPIARFGEAFDGFWKRLRNRHRVMVVRDAAYLDWRYARIPLRTYTRFAATAGGELAGYIVLRVAELLGLRGGFVVDFVTEASERGRRAGEALLSHALAFFAGEHVDMLAALMLPQAHEYRLLRSARFRPLPKFLLPQRFRLVARDADPALSVTNWFFTFGDYDVV